MGQEYEPANAAVTSMVNHLTTLQQRSDWFENNASLRDSAINETIAYFRDGEQVRSLPAQRAWQNLWSKQRAWRPPGRSLLTAEPIDPVDVPDHMEIVNSLTAEWQTAWAAWATVAD
jgi:hypothetical protein